MTTLEIPITFTLDTICPWTYLARRRLQRAISAFQQTSSSSTETPASAPAVTFRTTYLPFQLYPTLSHEGIDKKEWYASSRYGDSDEKWKMYNKLMGAYGAAEGIKFRFDGGGTMANTLHAHRVVWWAQKLERERAGNEEAGGKVSAENVVEALYRSYFVESGHPSSEATLVGALVEGGVSEEEARAFVRGEEGLEEVKDLIAEQKGNQVDSVPFVVIEGRRRDIQLEGAKEVDEYLSALKRVVKESQ